MNNGVEDKNKLGSNVVIAPAESYYDENGKVNENAIKTNDKPVYEVNNTSNVNDINKEEKPTTYNVIAAPVTPKKEDNKPIEENKSINKKSISLTPLFIIIIFILILLVFYEYVDKNRTVAEIKNDYSPIDKTDKDIELDVNSTLVKDLYSKIATTIKEDVLVNELNDEMKLYLAYRNLNVNDFYESDCSMFNTANSYNLTCDSTKFVPNAFSEESIQRSLKTLFGEETNIDNSNIQLGNSCLGGYQYIKERKEYVQGQCSSASSTSLKVTKSIKSAKREDNKIIIVEEVKYTGTDKITVPGNLQNGYYVHTFKLNSNYNYSYVSKEYQSKY